MRVTAETKTRTRAGLVRSARQLFEKKGFEQATTRDISRACGIAAGTLFNYFPSKEALGLAIIDEALEAAREEFAEKIRGDESAAELLFLHVAVGLRHLRPCRPYVMSIFESTLSPLSSQRACPETHDLRVRHLETVRELMARVRVSGDGTPPSSTAPPRGTVPPTGESRGHEPSMISFHLYWTLYLGVLAFWSRDESEHQQDTLVLLDQSMRLFVSSLSATSSLPSPLLPEDGHGIAT